MLIVYDDGGGVFHRVTIYKQFFDFFNRNIVVNCHFCKFALRILAENLFFCDFVFVKFKVAFAENIVKRCGV